MSTSENHAGSTWLPGLAISAFAGVVYLALRPPLFNYDGYVYRLQALDFFRAEHLNPHHLLWYPVQIALVKLTELAAVHSTVPFQIFGILVNAFTLFLFWQLLLKTSEDRVYASAASLFVAFSPKFWHLGLQNQPYPLVFLATVLYMRAWCLKHGEVLSSRRLLAAGLAAATAAFFQQAAVLLIPGGVLGLMVSRGSFSRQRLARALLWGGGASAFVLAVYVGLGLASAATDLGGFPRWSMRYLESQHSLQIKLPESFAKSIMGMFRSVAQNYRLEEYLRSNFSPEAVFRLFEALGIAGCAAVLWILRRTGLRAPFLFLMRNHLLFAVCLFNVAAWAAFVFAWEPSGYYWSLNLFPLLVCTSLLFPGQKSRILPAVFLLLSGWNVYSNHSRDKFDSVNFPEPLLESIQRQMRDGDIFIVLGRDWFGEIDYDLLLTCLDRSPQNPGRAILDWILGEQTIAPWGAAWFLVRMASPKSTPPI